MFPFSGITHKGFVRKRNEDAFLIATPQDHRLPEKGYLFVVADGLGGHSSGEVASRLAVQGFAQSYLASRSPPREALDEAIFRAHEKVLEEARRRRAKMGTTLTALAIVGMAGYLVHVGDSRIYLLRDAKLTQITPDHTVVQEWLEKGLISPEEARKHPYRHLLAQALGAGPIHPFSTEGQLQTGDRLLLSTDGLHGYVEEGEIARVLASGPPKEVAEKLIELALAAGGYDNVTVIVVAI